MLCAVGATWFGDGVGRASDPVTEMQVTTGGVILFMALVPGDQEELFVLVVDPETTNLGLGWLAMREALGAVRAAGDPRGAARP